MQHKWSQILYTHVCRSHLAQKNDATDFHETLENVFLFYLNVRFHSFFFQVFDPPGSKYLMSSVHIRNFRTIYEHIFFFKTVKKCINQSSVTESQRRIQKVVSFIPSKSRHYTLQVHSRDNSQLYLLCCL